MELYVDIDQIEIGKRHRKDMGDIPSLAESIRSDGLFHPIGITDKYELVFGARRIEAFRLLKLSKIPARIINISSVILGEYAENEIRKDFTLTERVAIAQSIERTLNCRQGRRTADNKLREAGLDGSDPNRDVGELVAKKAGLGTRRTYSDARVALKNGIPELVSAMDSRDISLKDAAAISRLRPNEQAAVLKKKKNEVTKIARSIRAGVPVSIEGVSGNGDELALEQVQTLVSRAIDTLDLISTDNPYATTGLRNVVSWIEKRMSQIQTKTRSVRRKQERKNV